MAACFLLGKPMSWIQIRFTSNLNAQQALEEALMAGGALSLTYQDAADQPILEPGLYQTPLWDALVLTALFEADIDVKQTLALCQQLYGKELPPHKVEILEDKDWVREWMDSYQPMQMGKRLWICPSWCTPPDPQAVNLLLDPGLAFGTGTHPTTAMCLQQLDSMDCKDKTVIDYGCGSGILAIAALLLGAQSAVGVDIDPQAISASADNAARNGIAKERISLYLPPQMPKDLQADIVLANILAGPLVELAQPIMAMLKSGGQLVLSGLLVEQKENLIAAYTDIEFTQAHQQEQWLCLYGIKKQSVYD